MRKHATHTRCARLNRKRGAPLRGWPRTNQWASALEWWKNVDEARRLTVEDRRDYIAAALAAGDVTLAAKQVQVLMAQPAPAAIDLMWAGQLASRQSDPVLALDYAERVLADKRAKPYEIASAATLVLSLTSPSSRRAEAWKRIEDVARDPKNPASLGALVLLAKDCAATCPQPAATHRFRSRAPSTRSPTPATQGAPPPGYGGGGGRSPRKKVIRRRAASGGLSRRPESPGLHAATNTCNTIWRYSDSRF
jgi:hypothetical protein